MGLLDLVKEEDSPRIGFQHLPKPPWHPGLIPKKELHAIEVLELRHIEPMESPLSEEIPGAFQGKLGLSDACWPKKKERSQRLVRRLKSKFTTFQNGTNSRDDMALSPDLGRKVFLQAREFLKKGRIGIHEWDGAGVLPRHHWRSA